MKASRLVMKAFRRHLAFYNPRIPAHLKDKWTDHRLQNRERLTGLIAVGHKARQWSKQLLQ